MKSIIVIIVLMGLVLGVPFLLKPEKGALGEGEDRLIVVSPHNEGIRYEFARGFREYYQERTGRTIAVDYRSIGGTSQIAQFLASRYTNAFRNHWTRDLGREWTTEVQQAYNNGRIQLDDSPEDDTTAEAARRAYLASEVSSGADVFWGGGPFDFGLQAGMGNLVPSRLLETHAEWFMESALAGEVPPAIPQQFAGETYWDAEGRWFGAVLSSFGLIYNTDSLADLNIPVPQQWVDLTDPRLLDQVAVADPTKSGSITAAFIMMIQQQMQQRLAQLEAEMPGADAAEVEARAVPEGWAAGMRVIQRIIANARYVTDSASKPVLDVAAGDCAAGMAIDFYGRFEEESLADRGGEGRFHFALVPGGTTVSCDPIGLLRGAPNEEAAELFIEYVLSLEGQKLWNFETGTPGGPENYALRRPPIRPELYREPYNQHRSDPDVVPYVAAEKFTFRGGWTGPLFSEIRVIIRIAFIDVRDELREAWAAIHQAKAEGREADAEAALQVFDDLTAIDYEEARTTVDAVLKAPPLEQVRFARELSARFRAQYERAIALAQGREG